MTLANSFARAKKFEPKKDRAKALKPGSRAEWLGHVKQATALVREQKARELDARSRAVGLERRREWREEKNVWRDRRTGRTPDHGERVHRSARLEADTLQVYTNPRAGEERGRLGPSSVPAEYVARAPGERIELEERIGGAPELTSRWHASRAQGKRELFERVELCGKGEGAKITLTCRSCKAGFQLEVGCNSHWFCAQCRARTANKFRADFERKRLGLITAATRAGLTRRSQPKDLRWGERLLTVTIPSVGSPGERVRVLRATWGRFWRLLREHLRPTMQTRSGITLEDCPKGWSERALAQREEHAKQSLEKYNKRRKASHKIGPLEWKKRIEFFAQHEGLGWQMGVELSHWDVLSYLHVFEWTMGEHDGNGHPHMHVWLFSRFLPQADLEVLWRRAYAHVTEQEFDDVPKLIVHINAAKADVAHELVKYLTKDWEISETGAKRVSPEVFAEVYAELDGKRMRQSSSGLSNWAVAKVCACPACFYERARGHWARVDIEHTLEKAEPLGVLSPPAVRETTQTPLAAASRERELRRAYLDEQNWEDSPEAQLWATMFPKGSPQ